MTIRELNPKTLSSGLDDYPRASHPNNDERHLDLKCWMLLAANIMRTTEELFQIRNVINVGYDILAEKLSNFEFLNEMHLDNQTGTYFDFGNHSEKVHLHCREVQGPGGSHRQLIREVSEQPCLQLIPHVGYVSLFPFVMKLIPLDSWILEKQLGLISNKSILWTSYGLCSLSKTSSLFMKCNTEHDHPYWRGPIWIKMNYIILASLHHYSQDLLDFNSRCSNMDDGTLILEGGRYKESARMIYEELRKKSNQEYSE